MTIKYLPLINISQILLEISMHYPVAPILKSSSPFFLKRGKKTINGLIPSILIIAGVMIALLISLALYISKQNPIPLFKVENLPKKNDIA